jgi:hypothetical protein
VLATVADSFQLVFYHSFRDVQYSTEYEDLLLDYLGRLFDLVAKPTQETQMGAALSILRLVQLDNITKFSTVYDMAVNNIFVELASGKCKVIANLLECLLFLNRAYEKQCTREATKTVSIMLGLTGHPSAKVRKTAVDNLFLLVVMHSEAIKSVIKVYIAT